jgi:glucose-1-phosphate thymidylyltransferase
VKCVILAAGYATRLRPLTDDVPKHLLPVGERPMLDWVLDRVREVQDVTGVHLVTNSRFARAFERWGERNGVIVHDDGTTSNDDRLGAVGDLRLAIERAGLESDELVVLAGDNLFDFSLSAFVEWWRAKPQPASAVPLHDVGDLELATQYGIADTDAGDRIVRFVEKPRDPSTATASKAPGTTSGTRRSSWRRTTGSGDSPGCRSASRTASTEAAPFRHIRRRSVGPCSTCSYRSAAWSAVPAGDSSAPAAARSCRGSSRLFARAAALRPHGRWNAAGSARDDGLGSRAPVRQSVTTLRRAGSSMPGRNAVSAGSRPRQRSSSPSGSLHPTPLR